MPDEGYYREIRRRASAAPALGWSPPSKTVPIYCPKCGCDEVDAEILSGPTIYPHPKLPCLRCTCGTLWRLSFHEVEEGGSDGG